MIRSGRGGPGRSASNSLPISVVGQRMLYELEVLEARRIAELAAEADIVRGRLLQEVRAADLGEPKPARGAHDPVATVVLEDLLATAPEFRRLRDAVTELPANIRRK